MQKALLLSVSLLLGFATASVPSEGAHANDCACPTVQANGKGNTSCSASESNNHCTVDYNLFSPASEQAAAELLAKGGMSVQTPPPINTLQALEQLALQGGDRLTDAVLVYLLVATADRAIDGALNNSADIAQELVQIVRPYRSQIGTAFSGENMQRWLPEPDQRLRGGNPGVNVDVLVGNQLIIAPGCVEVSTTRFWAMFKASWSPMRFTPQCRRR
ncbi:hypothetical protein [Bradyrhizobium pachyrhizi]|uniref:hypothetical protein n=1 Tax=Bradyrhizobium pachyrhizi TaxID=280333 RepID=UPI00067CA1CF|nr:hypothetical protein [Bradyrhizobium pachyrhizi]